MQYAVERRVQGGSMQGSNFKAFASQALTQPGLPIATVGLALAMLSFESQRMSSFQNVPTGSLEASVPSVAALCLFLLILLVYRVRPSFRLHRHPIVGFVIAGLIAASSLMISEHAFIPSDETLVFLARLILKISEMLLLLCWAELLIPLKARQVALLYALSLIVLGMMNAVSALIKIETTHIFVASLPLLSITCLYWYKDHVTSMDIYSSEKGRSSSTRRIDSSLLPDDRSRRACIGSLFVFLAPLACYSFIFGHIHFTWVPAQDGSFISTSVQLAAALGTSASGLILSFLIATFWGRQNLTIYLLFVLLIAILALYISSIADGQFSFLYVVPLNIAQKVTFLFIWLAPFLVASTVSPLLVWCGGLSLYQLGRVLSTSASGVPDSLFYTICVVIMISILIVAFFVGIVLNRENGSIVAAPSLATDPKDSFNNEREDDHRENRKQEKESVPPWQQSCKSIAKTYQLTRREEDILTLLAEGMTAQKIAQDLVISTATAKSHMRNIYAKLGIHTQSELLLLVYKKYPGLAIALADCKPGLICLNRIS